MGANAFGERFCVTTFGESHGPALGCVIDGCPAGVEWDEGLLALEAARRRPGQALPGRPVTVTSRDESDAPEILSGVYQGRTTGSPIAMLVRNRDHRPEDYAHVVTQGPAPSRPGHADDVWIAKFGHADPRGGGRASGRETVARVLAGAVAQMFLRRAAPGLRMASFVASVGSLALTNEERTDFEAAWAAGASKPADAFVARFPSRARQDELEALLLDAKAEGKSYGGVAEIWIDGAPVGLGQPVFRKLKSDLAAAFLSVGATAGIEIGEGFAAAASEGSEFHSRQAPDHRYGGLRGGISAGGRIVARVAFKPTSSVLDVAKRGRHDPCIVPRAAPVLEAMAWLALADHVLWARGDRV